MLKRQLLKRIGELNLTWTDIAVDANNRGMKISISTLSKYFGNSISTNLSDDGIVWLATRYGISISLSIGIPTVIDNAISFEVMPYDEKECLKALKKVFPKTK